MGARYKEYQQLNLPGIGGEVLAKWEQDKSFEKSVELREGHPAFVFYEGPPSANGMPGIHHVISRTLKDLVCRYKTMQGFQVKRKGGWDTHGLPIELGVEKELGITKEQAAASVPTGRIASPQEIADSVIWLLRPEARGITGHALPIDGGGLALP